jgi:hypothetical protein
MARFDALTAFAGVDFVMPAILENPIYFVKYIEVIIHEKMALWS